MQIRQHYYASVTYIDTLLGKLLKELNYDDTIVVLVSDHGWSLGEHADWAKYSNLDVALKVPLIIYDPMSIHHEIKDVVELLDIFPTLVQLAGLPKMKPCTNVKTKVCTQGKSLVNVIRNGFQLKNANAFSQYPRPSLYPSLHPNSDEPRLDDIQIMGYSIRTPRFRYTAWIPFDNRAFKGGTFSP